jgi:hypothetical protein
LARTGGGIDIRSLSAPDLYAAVQPIAKGIALKVVNVAERSLRAVCLIKIP